MPAASSAETIRLKVAAQEAHAVALDAQAHVRRLHASSLGKRKDLSLLAIEETRAHSRSIQALVAVHKSQQARAEASTEVARREAVLQHVEAGRTTAEAAVQSCAH